MGRTFQKHRFRRFSDCLKKSLWHFEPFCLEFSTTIPSNISMILSGCSKASNTSGLSSRKLLVVSAFESVMVRLNKPARRNLLWGSIPAILGVKARTPYVTSRYIIQKVLFIESTFDDIRHDPTMDFQGRFSQNNVSQQVAFYRFIKAHHCPFERS